MALTINYGGKKVEAPAPLTKAPYAPKAYSAVGAVCGDKLLKKLYSKGLVPHASEKLFMIVTKTGLMVYSSPWAPGQFEVFQPFMAAPQPQVAPPHLANFLTNCMNEAYLQYEAFLAKTEAAQGELPKSLPGSFEPLGGVAAKALGVEFATGKEPVVKLRNATKMYQLVAGSEHSSRYVVVAMTDDLKFAARLKNTILSIRVEGPGIAKHKSRLSSAGFSKFGSDYGSVHMQTQGDKTLAAKALGAVLSGLQLPLQTPWPDVRQTEKGI